MRLVSIFSCGLLSGLLLQAQTPECRVCPIGKTSHLTARHVVCLSDGEMVTHVATRTPVAPPGLNEPSMSLHGTVAACLCFSPAGKVEQIDVLSGPPLLQASVLESLRHWTFTAVGKGGKSLGGCGRLRVHVEVDQAVASSTLERAKP